MCFTFGGNPMLPKSTHAASSAFAEEMQAQTPWGPLGMRVQGSRGSQMGFLNESFLCVIPALEELWRSKFTEKIYRENTYRKYVFLGGESPNLPSRSLPLRISGIPHPMSHIPHAPGSAVPNSQGHLITGSRTSFNSSLIFFFQQKLLSI